MTYTARADELKAAMATVAGSGIVHNRGRLAAKWELFLALFQDPTAGGRVLGWEITRKAGTPEEDPDWLEHWELRHYRSYEDAAASELAFQEHLDAMVRYFRDNPRLTWGVVPLGMEITLVDERSFGGVLVHYAECRLNVTCQYDQL